MNAAAVKKMEIINELALLPENKLDEIQLAIRSILESSRKTETKNISLKGIWKNKGFEKIIDLETEIKTARQNLADAILKRKF